MLICENITSLGSKQLITERSPSPIKRFNEQIHFILRIRFIFLFCFSGLYLLNILTTEYIIIGLFLLASHDIFKIYFELQSNKHVVIAVEILLILMSTSIIIFSPSLYAIGFPLVLNIEFVLVVVWMPRLVFILANYRSLLYQISSIRPQQSLLSNVRNGWQYILINIISSIQNRIDIILLSSLFSKVSLVEYYFALKVYEILGIIAGVAANRVNRTMIAGHMTQNFVQELIRHIAVILLLALLGTGLFWLGRTTFLRFFDENLNFYQIWIFSLAFLFVGVFQFISMLVSRIVQVQKQRDLSLVAVIIYSFTYCVTMLFTYNSLNIWSIFVALLIAHIVMTQTLLRYRTN